MTYDRAKVGETLTIEAHRGYPITVQRGNDVRTTTPFGTLKAFRTLITSTEVKGERQYACHVIVAPLFRKSRITVKRVDEAVESWKEKLDELLKLND